MSLFWTAAAAKLLQLCPTLCYPMKIRHNGVSIETNALKCLKYIVHIHPAASTDWNGARTPFQWLI